MKTVLSKGIGRPDFTHGIYRFGIHASKGQAIGVGELLLPSGTNASWRFIRAIYAPEGYYISSITLNKIIAYIEGNYTIRLDLFEALEELDEYGLPKVGRQLIRIWFNQCYKLYTEDGILIRKYDPPQEKVWLPFWVGVGVDVGGETYSVPAGIYIYVYAIINYEKQE